MKIKIIFSKLININYCNKMNKWNKMIKKIINYNQIEIQLIFSKINYYKCKITIQIYWIF